MFKLTAFLAAFVAAASAASWPMVTVNSDGDIVLNSPTRAQSIQLTAVTVQAKPTTGTAVSLTSVEALPTDADTFIASIPTTLNTNGGYKLPTATVGRTITIFNDGTTPATFAVWTNSASQFLGGTATMYTVTAEQKWVRFTATSTTNWSVEQSAGALTASKAAKTIATGSAAATLTAQQLLGGFYTYTGTAEATAALTVATGSTLESANPDATVGDSFDFTLTSSSTGSATLTVATGVTFQSGSHGYVASGDVVTFTIRRTAASTYIITRGASLHGNKQIISLSANTALSAATHGGAIIDVTGGTDVVLTLPSCTASTLGVGFTIVTTVSGTDPTMTAAAGDFINIFDMADAAHVTDATAAAGTVVHTMGTASTATTTDAGMWAEYLCIEDGIWFAKSNAGVAPTVT